MNFFKQLNLILFCLVLWTSVDAQPLRFASTPDAIPVVVDNQLLAFPWAGGVNAAQFSNLDLNNDGTNDIIMFDRSGNKLTTFLVREENGVVKHEYTEVYNHIFPELRDWVIFYDYNCDGHPDIFTYMPGGIKVYKNTFPETGELGFEHHNPPNTPLGTPLHSKYESGFVNLFISAVNIPALYDVDGDGDMDILTFGSWGTTLHYHKNLSMEKYGHCDSLDFELRNRCWGYFRESFASNTLELFDTCNFNVSNPESPIGDDFLEGGSRHEGATLCPLDATGNGLTDLIIGDIDYWTLTLVENEGTPSHASMVRQDNSYPSYDTPVRLPEFPGAYYVDIDNDGKRDLLVSPNLPNNSENASSVWMYKNTGEDTAPVFEFQQTNFLQNQMIDVGEGAIPVLADIDGDGLEDLIISNVRYFDTLTPFRNQFMLLLNKGTTGEPVYELVSSDFLEISQYGLGVGLVPTFGDLTGNGKLDMVVGDVQGRLHVFENTSVGSTISFDLVTSPLLNVDNQLIDVGFNASPFLYDYSGNGKQDLIIGCRNGNVWYYENTGTTNNYEYTYKTDSLGKFTTTLPSRPNNGFSTPLIKSINGENHLFVGTRHGAVYHFTNIENPDEPFHLQNDDLLSYQGIRTHIAVGYLQDDERLSFFLGNTRGGISLYTQELVYADFSSSSTVVCALEEVVFTDESQGGAIAWEWEFEGGAPSVSSAQHPTVSFSEAGQYSVTLTVFFEDGSETITKTDFITVNALPSGEISVENELICSSLCDGVLTVEASGEGTLVYEWSSGSETSTEEALCEGEHTVVITDENGCQFSQTYELIAPNVEVEFELTTTHASCGEEDGCANLLSYEGGTTESLEFSWHDGSQLETLCGLYAGEYLIRFTDDNGCYYEYTYEITNLNAPQVELEVTNETCNDDCDGSVAATVINPEGSYVYQWTNELPNEAVLTGLCVGTYGLLVIDEDLCQSSLSYATVETHYPFPTVSFTPSSYHVDIATNATVEFSNQTEGATDYFWDFGDGTTSADANPSHTYQEKGTYTVVLTAYNGPCFTVDSVTIVVDNTLKVEHLSPISFTVYPNPATSEVTIKHSSNEKVLASLYTANGALVSSFDLTPEQHYLDVSVFKNGVYFLIFETRQHAPVVKKVVVAHE